MGRRRLKLEILNILASDDISEIASELAVYRPLDVVNPLFSALCSPSDTVRRHAVWAFGRMVPVIADQDMETARVIMRRLLWSLNDESGGIGWGAPEAIAEILAVHDRLAEEYSHMLISYMQDDGPEPFQDGNYLELPMLQRGLLWGIGRLCVARRKLMIDKGVGKEIREYLSSADPIVRGLAVWCLATLADGSAAGDLEQFAGDMSTVSVFVDGQLQTFTIGELVRQYKETTAGKAGSAIS